MVSTGLASLLIMRGKVWKASMDLRNPELDIFFDPFAAEDFNPEESFNALLQRYANNEVEHDYSADTFVRDAEVLLLDAQFVGHFAVAEQIVIQMHQLCAGDHGLRIAMNEKIEGVLGDSTDHYSHDYDKSEVHDKTVCKLCRDGKYCKKA